MAEALTLTFYNQSASGGYGAITQSAGSGLVHPWLAQYTNPDGSVAFTWTTDCAFCWVDSGSLVLRVQTKAEQLLASDLQTNNEVTLTFDAVVSSFKFVDQRKGQQAGALTIVADGTIPPNMVSVGLAQSGAPVTTTPAIANTTYVLAATETYFVGFGKVTEGTVLAIEWGPFQAVEFPSNIFAMDATLNADGSWTVQPTHL